MPVPDGPQRATFSLRWNHSRVRSACRVSAGMEDASFPGAGNLPGRERDPARRVAGRSDPARRHQRCTGSRNTSAGSQRWDRAVARTSGASGGVCGIRILLNSCLCSFGGGGVVMLKPPSAGCCRPWKLTVPQSLTVPVHRRAPLRVSVAAAGVVVVFVPSRGPAAGVCVTDCCSPLHCQGGGGIQVDRQDGGGVAFAELLVHRGVPQCPVNAGRASPRRWPRRGPSSSGSDEPA